MAIEAENLSFDNLKEIVDGLTCRNVSPVVTAEQPRGSFDLACFSKDDLNMCENPVVHFFDLIMDYQEEIDFHALGRTYKDAIEKQDLQIMPASFGLKSQVPSNVQFQMVILKDNDGHYAILKHLAFPDRIKLPMVRNLVYGTPYRAKWMNPVNRTAPQETLETLKSLRAGCCRGWRPKT